MSPSLSVLKNYFNKISEDEKRIDSLYRRLYFKFLRLEIPNFIQIIGLLAFFSYLSKNIILNVLVTAIVSFLLNGYFLEKFFEFIEEQIITPNSELNRRKLDDAIWMKKYTQWIWITSLVFLALIEVISFSIYYAK